MTTGRNRAGTRILWAAITGVMRLIGAARAENRFLPGMEDMPLAPGLSVVEDASLAFDSPSGRIVEAYAAGKVLPEAIRKFYAETLPALGWQPAGEDGYTREAERLDLDLFVKEGVTTLRMTVRPR